MRVTGFMLKEIIKFTKSQLRLKRDEFYNLLWLPLGSPGEPLAVNTAKELTNIELKLAQLKAGQQYYNLQVGVNVELITVATELTTLAEALALEVGLMRMAEMWRWTDINEGPRIYTVDGKEVTTYPQVSKSLAGKLTTIAEADVTRLRLAIHEARLTPIDVDFLNESHLLLP